MQVSFHSGSEKESVGSAPVLRHRHEGGTVPRTGTPARGEGTLGNRVRRGPAALCSVEILFLEPGLLREYKFYFIFMGNYRIFFRSLTSDIL